MLFILLLSLSFITPLYAKCSVRSSSTNLQGPSSSLSNKMIYLLNMTQNAAPISFVFNAKIYCDTPSNLSIHNLDNLSGHNGNATRSTAIMLEELKPTRYEGEGQLSVTTSSGDRVSTSNIFTRKTTGVLDKYPYPAGVTYTVRYTIPSLMLYSTTIGKRSEYETGGTILSICSQDDLANCAQLGLVILLKAIRSNTCLAGAFKTRIDKPIIDFGSISKGEIEAGKKLRDNFTITVEKSSSACNSTVSPKIIFNSGRLYDEHTIDLDNGLVLRIKDANNKEVKFGQPVGSGEISGFNGKPLSMKFVPEIERSPDKKPIKSGDFSSTVIYTMEYY